MNSEVSQPQNSTLTDGSYSVLPSVREIHKCAKAKN
uniref:Uncharacterized protein n=1 Tax=Anguilla anguilla TaxID=7936 RepID=A0A0E9QB74_ANGAN